MHLSDPDFSFFSFDCSLCGKDHSKDSVEGDMHYDASLNIQLVFIGGAWKEVKLAEPKPSRTATSTGTGSSIHVTYGPAISTTTSGSGSTITVLPSSTPLPPLRFPDITPGTTEASRIHFVARVLKGHLSTSSSSVDCACGERFDFDPSPNGKGGMELHLAQIALQASDQWDLELMQGNDEYAEYEDDL